jgi:hypothetical protein
MPTALALMLCNMDRICMSVAIVPIAREFGWAEGIQVCNLKRGLWNASYGTRIESWCALLRGWCSRPSCGGTWPRRSSAGRWLTSTEVWQPLRQTLAWGFLSKAPPSSCVLVATGNPWCDRRCVAVRREGGDGCRHCVVFAGVAPTAARVVGRGAHLSRQHTSSMDTRY